MAKSITEGLRYRKGPSTEQRIKNPMRSRSPGAGSKSASTKDARQNVVVKASYVSRRGAARMGRNFHDSLAKHEKYIGREGAGGEGNAPESFDSKGNKGPDVKPFEPLAGEERFYKVVISPERGRDIDLESYTKEVMEEVKQRTGLDLIWKAAVHKNTEQPHVHVIIRGVTTDGQEVNLKEFNRGEFRSTARDVATDRLGYRTERDLAEERVRTLSAERVTWIDRKIAASLDKHGAIDPRNPTIRTRLEHLRKFDLATKSVFGGYVVREDFLDRLKERGERNDITKTLERHGLARQDITFANRNSEIRGEVIRKDTKNELYETTFALIKDKNGKVFYFDGRGVEDVRQGDKVTVSDGRVDTDAVHRQKAQARETGQERERERAKERAAKYSDWTD